MAEEPAGRNWSTKTLARQLVGYLESEGISDPKLTLGELLGRLKDSIVEEEVGVSLDVWAES